MILTSSLFEASLKCPTKCFLKSRGETDFRNAYANWIQTETEAYGSEAREHLLENFPCDEVVPSSVDIGDLGTGKWRLAVDLIARAQVLESCIHAVEHVPQEERHKRIQFIPIRFVFANKPGRDDKLMLAFDALILSKILGRDVAFGKIIYGDHHATLKVKTSALAGEVRNLAEKTATLLSNSTPPDLVLNRHCAACEFQFRCRKKAIDTDDLSILPRMTEKERRMFHRKGIFSVTQLSYTFRPRRRPKRLAHKKGKYHHALKALAIREGKVHVVGSPEFKLEGTSVYLDVEGLPDRDFYYLIGARFQTAQEIVQHSLWADSVDDERRIWSDFLEVLSGLENPVLIHYGSYEMTFLKQMCKRYGKPATNSVAAKAVASPLNLLSVIFSSIYFPSYSNGLKDCSKLVGFEWSAPNASGTLAVVWRSQWEKLRDPTAKEALTEYNAEDCEALRLLSEFVSRLSTSATETRDMDRAFVVKVESLPRNPLFKFRKVQFQVPELETINQSAYWNYQRERIFVRSSKQLRRIAEKAHKPRQTKLEENKTISWPAPSGCPKCGGTKIYKHRKCSKTVLDVKFGTSGIKRWITKYLFRLYRCPKCRAVFRNHDQTWTKKKFGQNLRALSVYENIGLGISQQRVSIFLKEVLGFDLRRGAINKFKTAAAAFYKDTYERLMNKIANGHLVHADETRVNLKAGLGYVWAFTNLEDVVYVYAPSREGNLVHSLLKDFKGVLVSDFYAAYDSLDCPQQKCLVHLIRDLNDELMKEPFNEEIKEIIGEFAGLLKAIIATVDRFGLKSRFLRSHKIAVDRFFRRLTHREYQTETALKCKTRLEKNRSRLFTFLDFDGVPWNNNNAEHAIKAFALLRRDFNGLANEKGIREYLILLSICESCKFKGVSFLDFLRSGNKDVDVFAERKQRRMRKTTPWVPGENKKDLHEVSFESLEEKSN
jgi:predicted RecB family nuclease